MNIFWFEIKRKQVETNLISDMHSRGFNFIWTSLNSCWEVVFSLNTFYEIQNYTTEAQAYKNKIVDWVWLNGIYLEDNNLNIIENEKLVQNIYNVFSDNTFKLFKEKYFTHHFCSGDVYLYPSTNLLNEVKAQVVDSRTIRKEVDNQWNVIKYKQTIKWVSKDIPKDNLYNSIVRYNSDNPFYWASLYASILYDAMAEKETSRRNYYFFKNNAMPNVIFMLDPEIKGNELKLADEMISKKYKWTENSFKHIVSNWIKDAKVLDMSNKDLDLIQLREFFIKKMWMVYQIDPRIIWYTQNAWADRSISSIRKEAKETLTQFANQLEIDMNNFYKQFIDKKFPYIIRLDSETFEDRTEIEENQRKDIELWLQTIEMVWNERWYDIDQLPDQAKKPLIKSNLIPLEQSINTGEQI